jgi:hypothetical protein
MACDLSRREYIAQLRFRLMGDFDCLPGPVPGDIHCQGDLFRLGKDEIFVDCGAYDEDTLSLFLDVTGCSFKSAISSYHRQDDLWDIPLFIRGLSPSYSFHLRPHMLECSDLVCYAVPSKLRG